MSSRKVALFAAISAFTLGGRAWAVECPTLTYARVPGVRPAKHAAPPHAATPRRPKRPALRHHAVRRGRPHLAHRVVLHKSLAAAPALGDRLIPVVHMEACEPPPELHLTGPVMAERAVSPVPILAADLMAPPLYSPVPAASSTPEVTPVPTPRLPATFFLSPGPSPGVDVIWTGPQPPSTPPPPPPAPPKPPVAAPVPEPRAWALLIVGFFGLGGRLRAQARRRTPAG